MRNVAQVSCLVGFIVLSGCANLTIPSTTKDSPSPLPCPVMLTSTTAPPSVRQNQPIMIQALQKRLQEKERTIAAQRHQIEVLSDQLEALKQIDHDTRQPRKRLAYPIP
jgi:uncharacterized coiled-coil protein SlyX